MTTRHVIVAAAVAAGLSIPRVAAAQPPAPVQSGAEAVQAAEAPLLVRVGAPGAARVLTVFCDLEEDACARLVLVLRTVQASRSSDLAVVFRHLAREDHRQSALGYRAALAAAAQGKGWEMLDLVLANGEHLHDEGLRGMGTQLGLDVGRLSADTAADAVSKVLEDDARDAKGLKVEGVPALFLDGKRLPDLFTYDAIVAALKQGGPAHGPAPTVP